MSEAPKENADQPKPADAGKQDGEASKDKASSGDKKDAGIKAEELLPLGELTTIPENFKVYDSQLVDQILHVCDLDSLSPLKDSPHHYNIKIDWWDLGEKNGVKMDYAQLPGSANYVFRGVGLVPASPKLLEDAIRVPENMKLIDPMCKETKTIKTLDRDHHIYWASFKLPPLISDRDFCWFSLDHNLSDGTFISTGKSLLTKECENTSWHVRGEIRASGYVVQPVKDDQNSSRVTYVVQTDPRGWLPTKVVNFVARSQAYNPGVMKEKVAEFKEQLEAKAKALEEAKAGSGSGDKAEGGAQDPSQQQPQQGQASQQQQGQAEQQQQPANPAPAQEAAKSA